LSNFIFKESKTFFSSLCISFFVNVMSKLLNSQIKILKTFFFVSLIKKTL